MSEPHIDHDNGPRMRNNCGYVWIIDPRLSQLVLEICIHPEMLHLFMYIKRAWLVTQDTWIKDYIYFLQLLALNYWTARMNEILTYLSAVKKIDKGR